MLDRREFLKRCYQIGGIAAITGLGMGAVEKAMGWGILPAIVGGGSATATLYSAWDETTETVRNSAVWLMEGPDSENESGVDSRAVPLTGADLVATQAGSLAAASGTPPSRLFDGTDDKMTFTTTGMNVVSNTTNNWSLIIKAENLTDIQVANNTVFYAYDGTANNVLGCYTSATGPLFFQIAAGSVSKIAANVVASTPTTGIVHVAWWGDGTYVRCGWVAAAAGSGANGQPTKWSDFPANNRLSATTTCAWANGAFTDDKDIMSQGAVFTPGKIYYALMSDTCLIDSAA